MKNQVVMFLSFLFIATFANAIPQSYPLKCRGTNQSEMNFEFSPTTATLGFKKAAAAATAGLNPGECSWMDRPLFPGEPSNLVTYPFAPKNMFGTTTIRFGNAATPCTWSNVVSPLIGGRDPEIQWLKNLMSPTQYWLFQVYNDNAGHFIVTGSAPAL
jgi:hypothetical protein